MRRAALLALMLSGHAAATSITSAGIIAQTVNPASLKCLDHCVIGTCIWIRGVPPRVETTLKVRHRFPDIVVSAFETPGANPWIEMRPFSNAAAVAAAAYTSASGNKLGGGRHTPAQNSMRDPQTDKLDTRREQLRFYEAEIYGHPLASVIGQSPVGFGVTIPGLCPIKTTSFFPYFQSGFDVVSWRNPEVEMLYPATWIPYLRDVRNSTFTSVWGPVFPRHGFLAQSDPYKTAAVIAQRAADITTNVLQPHVYVPAPGRAANERTDAWQQLAPTPSFFCDSFGNDSLISIPSQAIAMDDDKVWQLWRPYECCLPNPGAILVTEVNLPAICLTSIIQ